ncbi:MAG: DNA/RNA nuclease SfsA [Butyrivibrio sp.]|nr:DNA/RNA nuclease SfsA [Butyrivibrio sp.]
MKYLFDSELVEGIIVKRKSQFTMTVDIDGVEVNCHCPTTGRIGDLDTKNIACLLSKSKDPNRKTPYTVEAISADDLDEPNKHWVGINQILSNKLVEFFLQTHQLDNMVSDYSEIHREVNLGISKLDFLVGNTYMEVKTPLNTLQINYGKHIKTKPVTPFSSTDRFVKHINELAGSLKEHERAILVTVYQYEITNPRARMHSTHYEEVKQAVQSAIEKGLESYEISMRLDKTGVELLQCKNITETLLGG